MPLLFVAVLAAALTWLAIAFGGGVAGTDQFWYAGDLLMTAETGRSVSNHVYPLFAHGVAPGTLPPRMHDAPVTHLASWVYSAMGGGDPGVAWAIVNVALVVVTAVIVVFTARALGDHGGWGAVALLVFPTTVWAALSPLAEASLAFGVAAMVGALVAAERTGRGWWWVVSGLAVGLLVWGRSIFALLLLAWVAWVLWSWRARRVGLVTAGVSVVGALGVVVGHAVMTESYPNAGFAATLMVGAAGRSSNMDFYFAPIGFDLGRFAQKAAAGAWRALTSRSWNEASATLPIVAAALAGLAARAPRRDAGLRDATTRDTATGVAAMRDATSRTAAWRAVVFMAVALGVTYVVTCAVFQPQTRYLFAAAPVAAVLLDGALTRWWQPTRRARRIAIVAMAGLVVVVGVVRSVQVAEKLEVAGTRGAAATAELRAALNSPSTQPGAVMVVAPGNASDIGVAYAAIPRVTISVDPRLNSPAEARELADAWGVTTVVAPPRETQYVADVLGTPTLPAAKSGRLVIWRTDR